MYVVERFLRQLVSRNCNFHIAFFDVLQEVCVPPGTALPDRGKFRLARAVIIRHLKRNLPIDCSIQVKSFQSFKDVSFLRHVRGNGINFAMCHDGMASSLAASQSQLGGPRQHLRTMILWFLRRLACNIALVNEVEFKDTKVRTVPDSMIYAHVVRL